MHSTSAIGLDEMIEDRREGGDLRQNVVHIEVRGKKEREQILLASNLFHANSVAELHFLVSSFSGLNPLFSRAPQLARSPSRGFTGPIWQTH